jgi:hypothetical protein
VVSTLTCRSDLRPPGPDKYKAHTEARFAQFASNVARLIQHEHELLGGVRFLNLLHDAWTSNNTDGIIGASIAFLDHTWRFRHIAVMAFVKNDGHDACSVAATIKERMSVSLGLDMDTLVKYAVSDTTPAARNVSLQFDDALQTDCSMHMLNLCIGYGIGMKENTRIRSLIDGDSNKTKKARCVVTEGGALPEGASVIRKLRALNNFFNSPQRVDRLRKLQDSLCLPTLKTVVDVDVRVASTCNLMKRSLVNYPAYKAYFRKHAPDTNSFTSISVSDWQLVVEMEAVTDHLARLALVEVQKECTVSSYLLVFRKVALQRVRATQFQCCDIENERDPTMTDGNLPRTAIERDQFSAPGQTCLRRLDAQIRQRFPPLSEDVVLPLLLDPRTKGSVRNIIAGLGVKSVDEERAIETAKILLQRSISRF